MQPRPLTCSCPARQMLHAACEFGRLHSLILYLSLNLEVSGGSKDPTAAAEPAGGEPVWLSYTVITYTTYLGRHLQY